MFTFTDVCACEIHRREVTEACRCACPDGIAPSKVSTSDDACDDDFLISAKSETSAILNLSERRMDAVKSGSLRCADEFKQQENKSSENVRCQANLLS